MSFSQRRIRNRIRRGIIRRRNAKDDRRVKKIRRIQGVLSEDSFVDPIFLGKFFRTKIGLRITKILGLKFGAKAARIMAKGDEVLLSFRNPNGNSVIEKRPELELHMYGPDGKANSIKVVTDVSNQQIIVTSPKGGLKDAQKGLYEIFPTAQSPKIAVLQQIKFKKSDEIDFLQKFRQACNTAFSSYSSLRQDLKNRKKVK